MPSSVSRVTDLHGLLVDVGLALGSGLVDLVAHGVGGSLGTVDGC